MELVNPTGNSMPYITDNRKMCVTGLNRETYSSTTTGFELAISVFTGAKNNATSFCAAIGTSIPTLVA
jgi:hypothetical protein